MEKNTENKPDDRKEDDSSVDAIENVSILKFLSGFPENIPGAKSVNIFPAHDAKFCLVHIRQAHVPGVAVSEEKFYDEDFLGDEKPLYDYIRHVQTDIFEITRFLHQTMGMKEIYVEGVGTEEAGRALEQFEMLKAAKQELRNLKRTKSELVQTIEETNGLLELERYIALGRSTRDIQKLETKLDRLTSQLVLCEDAISAVEKRLRQAIYVTDNKFNGARELIKSKKLKLRAAENEEVNRQVEKTRDPHLMFDARERFVIESFEKNHSRISIVLFGGNHDFQQAVKKWNQENPGKKFSLITITPRSLDQTIER